MLYAFDETGVLAFRRERQGFEDQDSTVEIPVGSKRRGESVKIRWI